MDQHRPRVPRRARSRRIRGGGMKLARLTSSLGVVTLLAIAGCGGGGDGHSPTIARTGLAATAPKDDTTVLEQSVRAAVQQNARLSNYVLWHNAIPGWASQSTGGPALAALRASAAARRRRH